jgi:hypothetical protein
MLGKYPRLTVIPVPLRVGGGVIVVVGVSLVTPQELGVGVGALAVFPPPQAVSIHAKRLSNRREEIQYRQDAFIR